MSDVVASDDTIALRRWRAADAEAVYAACQDPEIQYWIPMIPRPYTCEHARAFVGGAEDLGPHQFAVTENDRVVGAVGMRVNEQQRTGHIGYWCAAEARGRGVVTRALRLISGYGFEELGLLRLELITDPDNHASQRVAEKVGYRREGLLRSHLEHPDGRRRDSVMFSLLPGELR